jgi:hypothetical protein
MPEDPFGKGPDEICNKARNCNSKDLNENAQVSFRQVVLGAQLEYKWLFLPLSLKLGFVSNVSGITSDKLFLYTSSMWVVWNCL